MRNKPSRKMSETTEHIICPVCNKTVAVMLLYRSYFANGHDCVNQRTPLSVDYSDNLVWFDWNRCLINANESSLFYTTKDEGVCKFQERINAAWLKGQQRIALQDF